jgi:phosphoglycerate dehydrogenase-like enzyme
MDCFILIDLNRRTFALVRHVQGGGWGQAPPPVAAPSRRAGQTLGIVGLGAIGRQVGAGAPAAMRPTAYLLNLSRGQVVDQTALVHALTEGQIAGAALDVLAVEPPDPDDPVLTLDKCPHHAALLQLVGRVGRQLRNDAAENVVAALTGGRPRSVVNRPSSERNLEKNRA